MFLWFASSAKGICKKLNKKPPHSANKGSRTKTTGDKIERRQSKNNPLETHLDRMATLTYCIQVLPSGKNGFS